MSTPLAELWKGIDDAERVLAITLLLVVTGSALAIATVHAGSLILVTLLAATGLFAASRLKAARPVGGLSPPVVIMLCLTGLCVVQALPLPVGLLEYIAPANADVWARALAPLGQEVTIGHISLDPGATLREALKGVLYVSVFLLASNLSAGRGPTMGIMVVFGSAVLVAAVTIVHWATDAHAVFGVFVPPNPVAAARVGPLLNGNNLAGYLNLGIMCGLGIACSRRPYPSLGLVGLGIALLTAMTIRSGSRGGLAALALALIAFVVALAMVYRRQGRRGADARTFWIPAVIILGSLTFGGLLALLGGDRTMWADLTNDSLEKLELVGWVGSMVVDYPWLGIGRGAFESVFPAYRPIGGAHIVFTHAENLPGQWAAEWGVIVAAASLVLFAYVLRPTRLNVGRFSIATGAWLGAAVVIAHNFADLSLELPGIAVAVVAVLGTLWGSRRHTSRPSRKSRRLRPALLVPAIASAGVLLSAATVVWGSRSVAASRRELRQQLAALAPDDADARVRFRESLRETLLRHPADPYLPLLGGTLAWRARDESPMPWIQRSLERGLMNGRAHLLLAEVLADRGHRRQALLELRWALNSEPQLVPSVSRVAAGLVQDFDDAVAVAPEGQAGAALLVQLSGHLVARGRTELADSCDREALARDESLPGVRQRLVERRLAKPPNTTLCPDIDACRADVARYAKRQKELEPSSSLGGQWEARLLLEEGNWAAAETLLSETCEKSRDRVSCLELRIRIASEHDGGEPKVRELLRQYASERCSSATECARAHRWVGDFRAGLAQWAQASNAYAEAVKTDPVPEHFLLLASAAESAGQLRRAIDALKRLQQQNHDVEREARIKALETRLVQEQAPPKEDPP